MAETKHLIGISSFTFPFACGIHPSQRPERVCTPLDILKKAVEAGAGCVQFGDNMPLEVYDDAYLQELGRKAKEMGLVLEMGMREARYERIARYIEIANLTGAKLIRCVLDGPKGSYEPDEDKVCENITRALPALIQNDIILGIENHDRLQANDFAHLVQRMDDPHVGLVVDTTNSLSTEEPTAYVLEKMAPYCVSLHVKDYQIHRANAGMGLIIVGARLGTGRQDLPSVLKTARKLANRDFSLILESWMEPCATLEESLKQESEWASRGVSYMQELLRNEV